MIPLRSWGLLCLVHTPWEPYRLPNHMLCTCRFSMVDLLRKYIRYTLNEKPFGPDLVVNLIQLRKACLLDDAEVSEIINDISRRIVKDKSPVVIIMSGYSGKGSKRRLAVQVLFGKVYDMSELLEFCGRDSSLIVKEIFGVTE